MGGKVKREKNFKKERFCYVDFEIIENNFYILKKVFRRIYLLFIFG